MTTERILRDYRLFMFLQVLPGAFLFPYYVIFLQRNNLSGSELGLPNLVFMLAITLMEMPTGAIADTWGRKTSLLLGLLMNGVGCFCYSMSDSLGWFIIAELILAFSHTCISGAADAWVKDSLLHIGDNDNHDHVFLSGVFTSTLAIAAGGVTAGLFFYLAPAQPIHTLWLMAAVSYGILFLFFRRLIREDYFVRKPADASVKKAVAITKSSLLYCRTNAAIRNVVIFSMITAGAVQCVHQFWAPTVDHLLGFDAVAVVWLGITGFSLFGNWLALYLCRRKLMPRNTLIKVGILLRALFVLGMAITGNTFLMVPCLLLYEIPTGGAYALATSIVQENIDDSEKRATIGSFKSMMVSFSAALGWQISSTLTTLLSPPDVWYLGAAGLICALLFARKIKF